MSEPARKRRYDSPLRRQRAAETRERIIAAVAPSTGEWSEADGTLAAAVLDVLWSVVAYERLVAEWRLPEGSHPGRHLGDRARRRRHPPRPPPAPRAIPLT